MGVNLSNKYQSPERRYIRQIGGIDETSPKISVENYERIFGQPGIVWVAGNNPASETTGEPDWNNCCDKGEPKPDPEPEPSPEPDPDPDPDPDNPYLCECVNVGHKNATAYCCVSGKDCESGRIIRIQRRGGNTIADCEQPPPYGECTTAVIHFVWTGGESWKLTTIKSVSGDINSGIDENFSKSVQYVGGGDIQNDTTISSTRTIKCYGVYDEITYTNTKRGFIVGKCWVSSMVSFLNNHSICFNTQCLGYFDILSFILPTNLRR